jgi:hypothetical protein
MKPMRQIEITDETGNSYCYRIDSKTVNQINLAIDAFESDPKGKKFVKQLEEARAKHQMLNTKLDLSLSQLLYLFDELALEDTRYTTIAKIFDYGFAQGIKYQNSKNRGKSKL